MWQGGHGLWFNDHIEEDGETVFQHACKLGLEGIVSKRKGSPYRSGRSPDWLKMKTECAGREARGRGRLGAMTEGKNRIMIYGPKNIVEFRMADGEALAISVPAGHPHRGLTILKCREVACRRTDIWTQFWTNQQGPNGRLQDQRCPGEKRAEIRREPNSA